MIASRPPSESANQSARVVITTALNDCNQPAGTGACAAQIVTDNAARKGSGPGDKCFSLGTEEAIILRKENANYNQIKKGLIR